MASNFQIYSFKTRDSLHLKLTGDLDGSSAYELIHTLTKYNKDFYDIFIDTNDLNCIHPFGREVLKKKLGALKNQFHGIIFLGRNEDKIELD
jgi:anti-anti-sigma regulatory factor